MSNTTKRKTFDTWQEWHEAMNTKRGELAEIKGVGEARELRDRACGGLEHAIREANGSQHLSANTYHYTFQGDETPEAIREEAGRLVPLLKQVMATTDRKMNPARYEYAASRMERIQELGAMFDDATVTLERLNSARKAIQAEVEDLEEQAPKASASTLDDLRREADAAEEERDRIAVALRNVERDDGPLRLAQDAERTASERLDEAEALAAIGEADGSEVKAAKAGASKAATTLEKEREEHRKLEAARRGLQRKLEDAESHLTTVKAVYRTALNRVRQADLAARETALVEKLTSLSEDLADLDRIYQDLEEADPKAHYGKAVLTVQLPFLHHHARRDVLNDFRVERSLEVTSEGLGV
ncbi:hypothetical protein SAMN05421509_10780 [Chromohalobacter canadensis]|uniref:Uncharacterized protein n=1 Tax=Chromohalobacter canadensis TaxID=141389 RepID=A0A285VQY4_9GAMM|nr:hypothetical protein [Chromohalobacter canadensis]SOC56484.1 hypothetical protein SAMN05421509_10780 [Chromohalobacter canadensis]